MSELTEAQAVEIAQACGNSQELLNSVELVKGTELLAWFKSPDGMAWGLRWLAEASETEVCFDLHPASDALCRPWRECTPEAVALAVLSVVKVKL